MWQQSVFQSTKEGGQSVLCVPAAEEMAVTGVGAMMKEQYEV